MITEWGHPLVVPAVEAASTQRLKLTEEVRHDGG
jgi:hypothetical protein